MPQMIDIAEVEAEMEEFRISQAGKAEDPEMGCVFRAQLACIPAMTIWRAKEVNRGTDPNVILNAMVMLTASTFAAELLANSTSIEAAFRTFNNALQAIAEETAPLMIDPASRGKLRRFEPKEAGNA